MSADGNADTAVLPPVRGVGFTNVDSYCLCCHVSFGRRGNSKVARNMADHFKKEERCRPSGNMNYSRIVREGEHDMNAKQDQYQRLGKAGCDWFMVEDPTGTYRCEECTKLFGTDTEAGSHHKRSKHCNAAPPPVPVDCHETISGVLVEVLPRPLKQRKLDDTFAAAASTDVSSSSTDTAAAATTTTTTTAASSSAANAMPPPPPATPIPRQMPHNPYAKKSTPGSTAGTTPAAAATPAATTATPSILRPGSYTTPSIRRSATSAAITPGPTPGPTLCSPALASTPSDPSLAILDGLKRAVANGAPLPTPPRRVNEDKIAPFCTKKMKPTNVVLLVSMLGSPPSIDAKLDCILGYCANNKSIQNQVICRALHHYLHHHARKDTEDASANLRAILMVNSAQKDEDDQVQNATYTYPMEPDGMYEAAEATILYYYNNPQVRDPLKRTLQYIIDESASAFPGNPDKAGQMIASTLIIGRIFHSLLTEKPISCTDTAIITEIAASLCFYKQPGSYRIYHADKCSKQLASLLAVLRAGCCTSLRAEILPSTSYEVEAADFMKNIRSADTNSRIAQAVGHFRRLHDRTTFNTPKLSG